jgi:hypothetical protein
MSAIAETDDCCPRFDPAPWDGKTFEWENKRFVRDTVRTFFYVPINFGAVMKRLVGKVAKAQATMPESICLAEHVSRWRMDVYLAVDKEVPSAENATLSGRFLSKVYEGPYKDTGKWCHDFRAFATSRDVEVGKWYMWYTTCPKCAKKFGKNYVAIVGKVA